MYVQKSNNEKLIGVDGGRSEQWKFPGEENLKQVILAIHSVKKNFKQRSNKKQKKTMK